MLSGNEVVSQCATYACFFITVNPVMSLHIVTEGSPILIIICTHQKIEFQSVLHIASYIALNDNFVPQWITTSLLNDEHVHDYQRGRNTFGKVALQKV